MQIKKHLKPKKIILTLFIAWIIYIIGIPLYYTPYELQPSYWEFKKLCEINYMPDGEEKYNKILAYYGMSLDGSIDNNITEALKGGEPFVVCKSINKRLRHCVEISYKNKENKQLTFDNIKYIELEPYWDTRRINISGNEGNMDFRLEWKDIIFCGNIR